MCFRQPLAWLQAKSEPKAFTSRIELNFIYMLHTHEYTSVFVHLHVLGLHPGWFARNRVNAGTFGQRGTKEAPNAGGLVWNVSRSMALMVGLASYDCVQQSIESWGDWVSLGEPKGWTTWKVLLQHQHRCRISCFSSSVIPTVIGLNPFAFGFSI